MSGIIQGTLSEEVIQKQSAGSTKESITRIMPEVMAIWINKKVPVELVPLWEF